jgi:hypothetical protein
MAGTPHLRSAGRPDDAPARSCCQGQIRKQPVFGIIKRVMGWRQMSMRGLAKAQGEWVW